MITRALKALVRCVFELLDPLAVWACDDSAAVLSPPEAAMVRESFSTLLVPQMPGQERLAVPPDHFERMAELAHGYAASVRGLTQQATPPRTVDVCCFCGAPMVEPTGDSGGVA